MVLLTLLHEWLQCVEGGIMPVQYLQQLIAAAQTDDEAAYQCVLRLPPLYRDTTLFLLRLAWQFFLFQGRWRFNNDEEIFAKYCVIIVLPKRLFFDEHIHMDMVTRCVAALLRSVSVHGREPFLPEDPTVAAIENYKVLLYSGIRPALGEVTSYEYTVENVAALERTAEVMFAFGILPRTNTYGCSRHKLPVTAEHPLFLFRKENLVMAKTPLTRAYAPARMALGPFVDCLMCGSQRVSIDAVEVGAARAGEA